MGVIHIGKPKRFNAYGIAINDQGNIAGTFLGQLKLGFTRTPAGPIESFSVNGSRSTYVTGINSSNSTTGGYTDPQTGETRSFARGADGTVVLIDCPGFFETATVGINASGMVTGTNYNGDSGFPVGFIYLPNNPAADSPISKRGENPLTARSSAIRSRTCGSGITGERQSGERVQCNAARRPCVRGISAESATRALRRTPRTDLLSLKQRVFQDAP